MIGGQWLIGDDLILGEVASLLFLYRYQAEQAYETQAAEVVQLEPPPV